MALTFEQYVDEIQKLAEAWGVVDPGTPYCEPEAWRDCFALGLSPADAWAEEVSAAADM